MTGANSVHAQPSDASPRPAAVLPPAGAAPALRGAAAVLRDIAEGAEPLTFKAIARSKLYQRDGRKRHVSAVYRDAERGILDYAVIRGVRVSTLPAVYRAVARASGIDPAPGWSPTQTAKEHRRAEAELEAAGI